jgi:Predicted ABC-type transport system involved in lysophospholipase L1 biosynthesis, permease component
MSSPTPIPKPIRQRPGANLSASLLLARKLFRQTWGLLLVIVCATTILAGSICAIPLFSRLVIAAGIQAAAQPAKGGAIVSSMVSSDNPSAAQTQQIMRKTDQTFQNMLGPYLGHGSSFSISTPPLPMLAAKTQKPDPRHLLSIYGYNLAQISNTFTVVQGQLPVARSSDGTLQIALPQTVAEKLKLQVGAEVRVRYPIQAGSTVWRLRVVGILALKPTAQYLWHNYFNNNTSLDGSYTNTINETENALAPLQALLPKVYALPLNQSTTVTGASTTGQASNMPLVMVSNKHAAALPVNRRSVQSTTSLPTMPVLPLRMASGGGYDPNATPLFTLYWNYPLDMTRINESNLDTFMQRYGTLQSTVLYQDQHLYQYYQSPTIDALGTLQTALTSEQTLLLFFLLAIIGIAIYSVSLLAILLVERQQSTIALLSSRGAQRRQVAGAFTLQGLVLGIPIVCAGPLCGLLLVSLLAKVLPLIVPGAQPLSLAPITANLAQSLLSSVWLALGVSIVAVTVILISVRRATKVAIVELRQERTRTKRVPWWKRLYLDIFLALVLVAEGAFYFYSTVIAGKNIAGRTGLVLAPLILLGVPLILLVITLLTLRCMPWLLRCATRIVARSNKAPGVLAFAQMERQPQTLLRMVLLIATSLAFSLYLLSFIATQQSSIRANVNFQVGADFSGAVTQSYPGSGTVTAQTLQKQYTATPGVAAATLGYVDSLQPNQNSTTGLPISLTAIDSDTYAQTALWSPTYATQSLATITSQLAVHRADASKNNVLYAIVDAATWNNLQLASGMPFTLTNTNGTWQSMQFIALAKANYLPGGGKFVYNIFVDFQSYRTVYAHEHQGQQLQPNYVWLRAHDNAASLASIRHTWPTLQDRRTLLTQAQSDPVQLDTMGLLLFGLVSILVISLIGTVLSAWLSVKQRLLNFTLLRALGMSPRQIASTLLWEQGTIYVIALLLGLGIGWLLSRLVGLIFPLMGSSVMAMQTRAPVQAVLPAQWTGLLVGGLLLVCGGLLLAMARYATRPAISQTLRLNED